MSSHPLRCSTCQEECVYERHAPFGGRDKFIYGVSWRCPQGHGASLDVCPIGPLVPEPESCLNCGARYPSDAPDAVCGECGLSRTVCLASLGVTASDVADPIASARAAFSKGLFRRGLGIVNQALRGNRELPDAWLLKTGFLNSIGYNSVAADMLNDVISKSANAPFRILMLEERSFLRAESLDGVKALRSADAALKLGSNSIRTHYLRGRSLALLGRLREAREEMNHVLALDPNHADAQRARAMIDEASPPTSGKKWWQFWKL